MVVTVPSLLGGDIPNEFASLMHYLVPYVFLIYALGHKVELDWKKKISIVQILNNVNKRERGGSFIQRPIYSSRNTAA